MALVDVQRQWDAVRRRRLVDRMSVSSVRHYAIERQRQMLREEEADKRRCAILASAFHVPVIATRWRFANRIADDV